MRSELSLAALAIATATLAPLAPSALAHQPRFLTPRHVTPATALRIVDGTLSIAAYGQVAAGSPRRLLALHLAAGADEPLEILAPDNQPRRPPVLVDVRSPDGRWSRLAGLRRPVRFFEPFTRMVLWRTHAGRLGGARAGWWLVRVTLAPSARRQRMCVASGSREEIELAGLGDALDRIRAWSAA